MQYKSIHHDAILQQLRIADPSAAFLLTTLLTECNLLVVLPMVTPIPKIKISLISGCQNNDCHNSSGRITPCQNSDLYLDSWAFNLAWLIFGNIGNSE